MTPTAAAIARHLRPGCRVAIADGTGAPVGLGPALTEAAAQVGGIELLLGWCFEAPADLDDVAAFPLIRTFMGGYALREPINSGRVGYLPLRLGAFPARLAGPLRPDVVVVAARPAPGGFALGSEVAWVSAAIEAADTVLVEVNNGLPAASGEPAIPADRAVVVAETDRPPYALPSSRPDDAARRLGELTAALVPAGAAIQFGPGRVADAVLAALEVPVHVDSGVATDAVVDLDERGLLLPDPTAAYLTGGERLYEWAEGRPIGRRVEYTHDITRLSARPFVSLNTALELDREGQVNVERIGADWLAGVGGHGDYALAASRSAGGLSIVAVPRLRGASRTLVDRLTAPASTAYADVDVVVTERGVADVRGLPFPERGAAIAALWDD